MKNLLKLSILVLAAAGLAACAAPQSMAPFSPQKIDAEGYAQKVDNLLVVLDASSSMGNLDNGYRKYDLATGVVQRLNQTLPALDLTAGLRTFGHAASISKAPTMLASGMAPYTKTLLPDGLAKVPKAGGVSPLSTALDAAGQELGGLRGKTALIVISDGADMGMAPVAAAEGLVKAYGDDLCIQSVQVGKDPAGALLMEKIAAASSCGGFQNADAILTSGGMASFVQNVFLGEKLDSDGDGVADAMDQCAGTPAGVMVDGNGCPVDTDGDGVADYLDKCPDTPAGAAVDGNGCPVDTDGDGVADYLDKCPGTPAGMIVDAEGCPKATKSAKVTAAGTWLYEDIRFANGKADLAASSTPVLQEIATAMKANPEVRVEIQGHTDSRGSLAFNERLSQQRADAVRNYLIDQGIAPERMTARGYGPHRPIADNDTADGRAQNRRVELKPLN
ncbi:MAG: OmpA family protein [Desulfosarcinaceae bacterium]|nr:OmpA family protein [Desulfosarcinaceae bacterium]